MKELINQSVFLGVLLTLVGYQLGFFLKKKWNIALFNPLVIATVFVMLVITVSGMDLEVYEEGSHYISYFLTPATICLALPLYDKWKVFKKHYKAVVSGIVVGVFTNLMCILLLAMCFKLTHTEYVTLLPKSITTAMGLEVSHQMGGIVSITVFSIIVTGVFGAVIAPYLFKVFRIHMPIAKGVALGTGAHAIGTSKAIELGEVEAAMSSVSIVLTGSITILAMLFFQTLL